MENNKEIVMLLLESINTSRNKILAQLEDLESQVRQVFDSYRDYTKLTVKQVRHMAILDEVYSAGGSIEHEKFLQLANLYGKETRGLAGYFSGNNPSITLYKGTGSKKLVLLTDSGKSKVEGFRLQLGDDWLSRVDKNHINNKDIDEDNILII